MNPLAKANSKPAKNLLRSLVTLQLLIILLDIDFVVKYLPFEIIPYGILALIIGTIFNNLNLGIAVSSSFSFALYAINEIKFTLLKTVISVYDLFFIKNFELVKELLHMYLTIKVGFIIFGVLLLFCSLIILSIKLKYRIYNSAKARRCAAVFSLCLIIFVIFDLRANNPKIKSLYRHAFNWFKPEVQFNEPFRKNRGGALTHIILYFDDTASIYSIKSLENSNKAIVSLANKTKFDVLSNKPDIVIVLHESIFNINDLKETKPSLNLEMFNEKNLNCLGNLKVNVYGGAYLCHGI